MMVLVIARKISSGEKIDIVGAIRRLFSQPAGALRSSPEVNGNPGESDSELLHPVDPREQNLYDSAQTIRKFLLIMATNIKQTDKAASDSSLVLGDVKS